MNRRNFLRSSLAAASTALTGVSLQSLAWAGPTSDIPVARLEFPSSFKFGAASSSVQIEGAAREDGKGESTWDRFARIRGSIRDGSTPDVTCDFYHRWKEDIALLKRMHLQSFRFSIAWPRIFPKGRGTINQKGLDFYSNLIDGLLEANIDPLVTCFHWDLPAALEDEGGWPNRDTASYFADYCGVLAKNYGDRVKRWCLLNEPQAFTVVGYGWGAFPPGQRDRQLMLRATHTANLALGLGFRAMKSRSADHKLGIAHDFVLGYPLTDSEADRKAWNRYDAFRNRWFLDPAFTGKYPEAFEDGVPAEAMGLKLGDEDILKVPLDYSGVNFYCGREYFASGETHPLLHGLNAHQVKRQPTTYSAGMRETMLRFTREYKRPIEITETGFEWPDVLDLDGRVRDTQRIAFMRSMLANLHRAILEGADVRALHIWSLLDDWEWNSGLKPRIGLTYIDYRNNLRRTLKDSGAWYGEVARTKVVESTKRG